MSKDLLGPFEYEVMSVLMQPRRNAYGASIHEQVEFRTGRTVSIGAVHATLERLQEKGFISSRWGEPTPQRGGRRKRYYRIEALGIAAVERTKSAWDLNGGLAHA